MRQWISERPSSRWLRLVKFKIKNETEKGQSFRLNFLGL